MTEDLSRLASHGSADEGVRSILVFDGDPVSRARTESALRDEHYWVYATGDEKTVARLAHVGAADVVLTDLSMAVLDVVPRWQRRRTDIVPAGTPPSFGDGYAVLRPLQEDPSSARFPIVVLSGEPASQGCLLCRFGVVGYVPKAEARVDLLRDLETIFRDLVLPVRQRQAARLRGDLAGGSGERADVLRFPEQTFDSMETLGPGERALAQPFDSLPKILRTALLVDPDASYRRFIRDVLGRHGFSFYEAEDGYGGFRLAAARRPWLILTEVNLPGQNGFEFCARVRNESLLRHTPLVFLSDWDDYEKRYYGLKLGADDYLTKPIPTRELLIRLQLILRRYSDLRTQARHAGELRGDFHVVGVTGILQMCHLGQLTGVFTARSGMRMVRAHFRNGDIIGAECGRATGAEAIYEFLTWTRGHFDFIPGECGGGDPIGDSFDQLILEGCRRLDESHRNMSPAADGPPRGA